MLWFAKEECHTWNRCSVVFEMFIKRSEVSNKLFTLAVHPRVLAPLVQEEASKELERVRQRKVTKNHESETKSRTINREWITNSLCLSQSPSQTYFLFYQKLCIF